MASSDRTHSLSTALNVTVVGYVRPIVFEGSDIKANTPLIHPTYNFIRKTQMHGMHVTEHELYI